MATETLTLTYTRGTVTYSTNVTVSDPVGTITHGQDIPSAYAAGLIGATGTRTARSSFTPVANTTYSNLTITGTMTVNAGGVVFNNCYFKGTDGLRCVTVNVSSGAQTVFNNCTFDGQSNCDRGVDGGYAGKGGILYRCDFINSMKDAHINDYWSFTECYMHKHGNFSASTGHRECILRNDGTDCSIMRCYTVYESVSTNNYVSCAIALYGATNTGGVCKNGLIQDSYIDGGAGGYAVYMGDAQIKNGSYTTSNMVATGNIFGRSVNARSGYASDAPFERSALGLHNDAVAKQTNNVWGPLGVATSPPPGTLITT